MPRYSIDIDLAYLPIEDRLTTFRNIHEILKNIKSEIELKRKFIVKTSSPLNGKEEAKIFVRDGDIEIKIEPNYILRGSLFPPEYKNLSPMAEKKFNKTLSIQCLN